MSKIIVYEQRDFSGLSKEFTSSVPNLINENFNKCIFSLKVIGAPWVAYSDVDFKGNWFVYEEGEYAQVEQNDGFSSLEMVTEDLSDPQITLYEHANYEGRSLVLKTESNLYYGSFNNIASSHKVQRGAWILYENCDKSGAKMVARASRDVSWYEDFNDKLSFLCPLKPGKPVITAEVLWDKKEEDVKSVVLEAVCALNHGYQEQSFTTQLNQEYEGSITDSFSFSNATQISWRSSFAIDVAQMKGEHNFSLSDTFTVEKGKSNTRSEKKSVQISLPVKIPPHTKLTVNVVRKEVDVKIPVRLIITTGCQKSEESGEYRCQFGYAISTEYNEERI